MVTLEKNVKYYPLTHPQKGIWYTEKLYPGTSIGVVAGTMRIKGNIDYDLLRKAIYTLLSKCKSLKLHFIERNGEPFQFISNSDNSEIDYFDFSKSAIESLYKWDTKQTETPFEILNSDLYYFAVLKISDDEAGVYIKIHHLICDAWSITQVGNKIFEYYSKLKNNMEIDDDDLPSYMDFILSELEYFKTSRYLKDKEYWNDKYKTIPELAAIKVKTTNSVSSKAKRKTFVIPVKLGNKIQEYCLKNKTTNFSIFLSAIAMYINRIYGKEDIVLGIPVLNRSNIREKETIGMFIGVMPIRVQIDNNSNFKNINNDISVEWMTGLKHHKYPYDFILNDIRENKENKEELFDIMLSYQNAKYKKIENFGDFMGRWHFNGHQKQSLYIHINDREDNGNFILDYDYKTDLFYEKEIEFLHDHIIRLLWHALDNPDKIIRNLDIVSEKEKNKILCQFNNSAAEYPTDKTIHQLFEEQVERTPNGTAVVFNDIKLTYNELNHRANQLARKLRSDGVKADSIVGIMAFRSIEMIVSIFAVLKAGGAFLPLDPDYPRERLDLMVKSSNTDVILCQTDLVGKIAYSGKIINIDDENNFQGDSTNLIHQNSPDNLIYVIFTSGSTGIPKGVMLEHKNIVNLMCFEFTRTNINFKSRVLQFTTINFDVSYQEIFSTLLFGGELFLISDEMRKNASQLLEFIEENYIRVLFIPPSYLKHLTSNEKFAETLCKSIRHIIVAGEQLLVPELLKKYLKKYNVYLHNHYGPSETHVASTFTVDPRHDIPDIPPIGKPISNARIYLLDSSMNLVPIGAPGELFISGDCVGRGYINRPDLTSERFIENPFEPGERMYKTGDNAKWKSEGDIEFLGRRDFQIKIRGFRIELGEIENQLLKYEDIKNCVVIDRINTEGHKYLCAYIEAPQNVNESEVKGYLSGILPYYMIPSQIVKMDKLPLTPNGKIDRNALPDICLNNKSVNDISLCRNKMDELLIGIWKNVLGGSNISIDDTWQDLGGDSLSIISIQTKLYDCDIHIDTQDLYRFPSVRLLSDFLLSRQNKKPATLADVNVGKRISLNNSYLPINHKKIGNILLTGTTGYLGAHILYELLKQTNTNIYCLVRGNSHKDAKIYLKSILSYYFNTAFYKNNMNRIIVVNGDITINEFGLGKQEFAELTKKIDIIIHSAALVKHYGDYNEFERINVVGTNNIINFAKESFAELYHISTIGISGHSLAVNKNIHYRFTENDYDIGQNYQDNMYVRSKFEAEGLIISNLDKGLNSCIIRVGNLTNRYSDYKFQKNPENNAFQNKLKAIIDIGHIPENFLSQEMEITPVDLCAKAIVKIMVNNNYSGKVFHLYNPNKVNANEVIKVLKSLKVRIKIINDTSYALVVKELLKNDEMLNDINWIINDMNSDKILDYASNIALDCSKTMQYLKKLGFIWPDIDINYLSNLLIKMLESDASNWRQKEVK